MLPKDFSFNVTQSDQLSIILKLLVELKVSKDFFEDIILQQEADKRGITLDEIRCMHASYLDEHMDAYWKHLYEHYAQIDNKEIGLK